MRRVWAVLLAFALVMSACGGDDDDASGNSDTSVTASDNDSDADADGSQDADDDATEPADPPESPADDESDEEMDDSDEGESISVNELDDVPQVCRDLMEEFLKEIEPIVSPIDWDNATISDFETIAPEFEQLANDFSIATEAEGQCDNLEIDDEENFELIIQFAGQVAPGTVGFMTFISDLSAAAGEMVGDDDGPDVGGGEDAFDDCEGAVAWMEELMAEYDSMVEVPVAEMMQFADLGSLITTCTPEQLEYFDSPEVQEFLSGL